MTFTPKISVLAQKMGSGERARVRFFQKICLSVGVSEIEKTKKRQSHRISAKILILNAPPMTDVHTKNQSPTSKNGLGRACLRPGARKKQKCYVTWPSSTVLSAQSRDIKDENEYFYVSLLPRFLNFLDSGPREVSLPVLPLVRP